MGGQDFDRIIDAVYDAADDPAGFAPAMEKLAAALRATANHTLVISTATNIAENHHFGADPASFIEYDRDWREHDPRFSFALANPGVVVSDVMVLDPSEFERSALYNEHLERNGVRYTMFTNVRASPDVFVASAFMRAKEAGAFDEDDVARMSAVVPHLKRAVRLRHVVTSLRAELADLQRALDVVVVPLMILDAKAKVLCANQVAEQLLRARDGLRSDKARLVADNATERAALERAIAKAAITAETRSMRPERPQLAPSVKVTLRDGTILSIALLPLRPQNELRARSPSSARVLALVHDPRKVVRVDRAVVAELHGLTATEAELAASLAEGKTLAEFADARGTSEQTARTHLKRILDKTDTRRQADLVRLVLTGLAVHRLR